MINYEKYKSTDVMWFPELPEHWGVFRFADEVFLRHGFQFRDYDFTDTGTKIIKISQLNPQGYLDLENCSFIDSSRLKSFNSIRIKDGDILMALTGGTIGKIIKVKKVEEPLLQNYRVGNFFPNEKKINKSYLFYLLASQITELQIDYLLNRNGQPNIGKQNFKAMFFCLPPLSEQKTIAQYLDTKTQAIDKKISLLHQKIDYYKELRQSLINDAVTKGLDKEVTLKETEIFVRVPQHWKRYRLKEIGDLFSGLSGKSGDDFRQDDDPNNKYYIPFTNIAANTYISKDNLGSVVIEPTEKQNKVKKGDLFFLMSSEGYEDIGKSSVLNIDLEETYLNSFCKGFRLKGQSNDPHFVNYLLLSDSYRQLLIIEGKGFTRINLKMEKVNDFFVHLPPTKEEQLKIAQYLDKKTSTIDAIVNNIKEQIEKLQELRKTLINDVVIGKIKVAE